MRSTRELQRLACQRRPSVVVVSWREDGLPWRQKAAKQQGKGPPLHLHTRVLPRHRATAVFVRKVCLCVLSESGGKGVGSG